MKREIFGKEIPQEKLKSVHIEMDGQKKCYEGEISINGVKMGRGIRSVYLTLDASQKPVVAIDYSEELMDPIEKELLGLND